MQLHLCVLYIKTNKYKHAKESNRAGWLGVEVIVLAANAK